APAPAAAVAPPAPAAPAPVAPTDPFTSAVGLPGPAEAPDDTPNGLPVRTPGRTMAEAEREREQRRGEDRAEDGTAGLERPAVRDAGSRFGAFHRARRSGRDSAGPAGHPEPGPPAAP
ncbi:ATP-binding protein, partial [Streptomyces sp. JW3]